MFPGVPTPTQGIHSQDPPPVLQAQGLSQPLFSWATGSWGLLFTRPLLAPLVFPSRCATRLAPPAPQHSLSGLWAGCSRPAKGHPQLCLPGCSCAPWHRSSPSFPGSETPPSLVHCQRSGDRLTVQLPWRACHLGLLVTGSRLPLSYKPSEGRLGAKCFTRKHAGHCAGGQRTCVQVRAWKLRAWRSLRERPREGPVHWRGGSRWGRDKPVRHAIHLPLGGGQGSPESPMLCSETPLPGP